MIVIFELQGINFEWDEEKYAANLRKHGVKFETAAEVFFDPFHQTGDTSVAEKSAICQSTLYSDFISGKTCGKTSLIILPEMFGKNRRSFVAPFAVERKSVGNFAEN
ncbi:MAG: BrnT family toxin [Acidobacteria bacterium]|jgi:hypothetical protein|nr:BrnT family toxin [Acidobacteriota bacterium]